MENQDYDSGQDVESERRRLMRLKCDWLLLSDDRSAPCVPNMSGKNVSNI